MYKKMVGLTNKDIKWKRYRLTREKGRVVESTVRAAID